MIGAAGLFVATSSGFPAPAEAGTFAHAALWAMHVIAPALLGTYVVDAALKVMHQLRSPYGVAKKTEDHVIVCGLGKHGRFVLEQLAQYHAVVIERDRQVGDFTPVKGREQSVPVLHEDLEANVEVALQRAGAARAKLLIAATGSDVLNLGVCLAAHAMGLPQLTAVALVADDVLARDLRPRLAKKGIEIRNSYELAAQQLVKKKFGIGPPRSISLVVVGFGRFGQALVRACCEKHEDDKELNQASERVARIVLIDVKMDAKRWVLKHAGYDTAKVCVEPQGDAEDPDVIGRAMEARVPDTQVRIVLCTDNETGNLRLRSKIAASVVRDSSELGTVLLTRTFNEQPPGLIEAIASEGGGEGHGCFHLYDLLATELGAEINRLMSPTKGSPIAPSV